MFVNQSNYGQEPINHNLMSQAMSHKDSLSDRSSVSTPSISLGIIHVMGGQTLDGQTRRSTRAASVAAAAVFLLVLSGVVSWFTIEKPKPARHSLSMSNEFLAELPTVGLAVSTIQTSPPFLYTYMSIDSDSYQVRKPEIRALEPGMTALWGRFVGPCCKEKGHVVDIGSHFGYYSLYSAALGCTFSAIEPVNKFRAVLMVNLQMNGFIDRGHVHSFAAGDQARPIKLAVPESGVMGLAHIADGNRTDARQSHQSSREERLDDQLDFGSSKICGLKIDVEGYEPYALLGAGRLLASKKVPFIMMEFSPGHTKNDLALESMLANLHEIGYRAIEVDWGKAKQNNPPAAINTAELEENIVDIGSEVGRRTLIARVRPRINTNLWLSLEA